jgi:hypothetical protein
MNELRLDYIPEPQLIFGSGQRLESPKDGLFLFGPEHAAKESVTLRIGVIGTKAGITFFNEWISRVRGFVPGKDSSSAQHRPFLGFNAIYSIGLPDKPVSELVVSDEQIDEALLVADRHVAIFRTVDVFSGPIRRFIDEEESVVDVWFVVIPERVFIYGRPKSVVPVAMRVDSGTHMDKQLARELINEPSLFAEDNEAAEPYLYEVNFHNQLKARLLEGPHRAVVQIVRETVVAPGAFLKNNGMPLRAIQDPATVAWNLCTTAYFKSGRRPWRLARVRDKVCYVGLVFKHLLNDAEGSACCGAQMFLDSGDGLVFKGAVGPWRSANTREYHVSREGARTLLATVVDSYKNKEGCYPTELFIHGQTAFNDDEWEGFTDAVPPGANLVGVRIRSSLGEAISTGNASHSPGLRVEAFQSRRISLDPRLYPIFRYISRQRNPQSAPNRSASWRSRSADGDGRCHGFDEAQLQCVHLRRRTASHSSFCKRGRGDFDCWTNA